MLIPAIMHGQDMYSVASAEQAITRSHNNKAELTKALGHFRQNSNDSLKLKAMCFLLSNMDIHYSADYFWIDSTGKRIEFDELKFKDFAGSIQAFEDLKAKYGKLRPVSVEYRDIETIKADFLINNVNEAFKGWEKRGRSAMSFADFCEYVLPYRITIEPLQEWRTTYREQFSWMIDSAGSYRSKPLTKVLINDVNKWFTCLYDLEKKTEPLPRLGSIQALHRKKGYCEDVADLSVFALRSLGVGASVDIIPYWATSSGSHQLNHSLSAANDQLHFDVLFKSDRDSAFRLVREPGKVFRVTYSKQPGSLPLIAGNAAIPESILENANLKDVTPEYWPTGSFYAPVSNTNTGKIVYACVLNFQVWQPVWWSNTINPSGAYFEKMSKGVVYLPQVFENKALKPAGYPVAFGYNNMAVLKPDTLKTRTVEIKEQEGYLRFQTGKKYRLYYWDNKWKPLELKMAQEKTKSLSFQRVPENALLILIPEYSKHKERPFIITGKGERVWF